jgi:rhodanese-related sulfurtransferase
MNRKIIGAFLAIILSAGLILVYQLFPKAKSKPFQAELEKTLVERQVQIDPGELVNLIYNYNTPLRIFDVRDEAQYNLFHIVDAVHVVMDQIQSPRWVSALPKQTVIVLVSNDEKQATDAWKLLAEQGVKNLYIVAGGINMWLDLFYHGDRVNPPTPAPESLPSGNEPLKYSLPFALGDQQSAADPDPKLVSGREYTPKVKPIGRAPKKTGGCG